MAASLLYSIGCLNDLPPGLSENSGFSALVFAQRASPPNAGDLNIPDPFRPGGNLVLLKPAAPAGRQINLTGLAAGDVQGFDFSPDGKNAVAAVRTGPADRFHLLIVDVEKAAQPNACFTAEDDLGPACRMLTFGPADDTAPFFLADGRIAFLRADPDGPVDFLGRGRSRMLFVVEADGSGASPLDIEPGHLLGAGLLSNGWIQAVRWMELAGEPVFRPVRLDPNGTVGVVPDGPPMVASGVALGPVEDPNESNCGICQEDSGCPPGYLCQAGGCLLPVSCQTDSDCPPSHRCPAGGQCLLQQVCHRILAGCVPAQLTYEAGTVCQRTDTGEWKGIVNGIPSGNGCSPEGRVRDPVPLLDGRFLVSYAKMPGGCLTAADELKSSPPDFGLAILDPFSDVRFPVVNTSGLADLLPKPLAARSLLSPGVVLPPRPDLGCSQPGVVFEGMVDAASLGQGAVRLRVLQGLSGALAPWAMEIGGDAVGAICGGDSDGDGTVDAFEVPLQGDGSFRLRVPAGVPLRLQLLDHYGGALRTDPLWRGGPNCAQRRCDGCHANGGRPAGFDGSQASAQDPFPLDGPGSFQKAFDFRRDIQPILNRSCATTKCHDATTHAGTYVTLSGGLSGLDLSASARGRTSVAYENLLFLDALRNAQTGVILQQRHAYVVPGQAMMSRLIQRLGAPCRFDCASVVPYAPWGVSQGQRHPENQPTFVGTLTDADRAMILEWIDAGAPFLGPGATP